ncbi:MAG: T9SS type A sorting domain-containing protein [Bacteroidetes bacterium]|nr:T9SS type A sorting domain-containing protein [Bacteroidota bacterium]
MGDCRLTACQHANGRDWWLVNHRWNDSLFNKWLVTPDSIYGPFTDTKGTVHKEIDWYGMAQFSQDGTKYAMGSSNGLVNIFDFNRCSGEFSNLRTINFNPPPPFHISTLSSVYGVCFSPNGRYLYLTGVNYIGQYDTESDTIENSRIIIAMNDSTYQNDEPFFTMALSPQNEIFICNKQGFYYNSSFHIIHEPDSGGLACNFEKEALPVLGCWDNTTLPNLVNLKLGADTGSLCDTIVNAIDNRLQITDSSEIQVFPNPANEVVYVEEHKLKSKGELEMFDAMGRRVYVNEHFDEATVVNVKWWVNGLYFYSLKTKEREQRGKFIVEN